MSYISPWWGNGFSPPFSMLSDDWSDKGLGLQALNYNLTYYRGNTAGEIVGDDLVKSRDRFIIDMKAIGLDYALAYDSYDLFVHPRGFVVLGLSSVRGSSGRKYTGNGEIRYGSTDFDLFNQIEDINKKYVVGPEKTEGKVYVLISGKDEVVCHEIGVGGSPLIRDNYTNDVLKWYDLTVSDLGSANPLGRLSIFDGPPGTGKTYLVKALLNDLPKLKFLVLPSSMIQSMDGPDLLPALISASSENSSYNPPSDVKVGKGRPLVLIIEDADSCMAKRETDNMSSVSNILNLSDGIIGNLLDLRIICTTNAEIENIDGAIIRSGRLTSLIHVGLLSQEQAKSIYSRLSAELPPNDQKGINWDKPFYALSDVYAAAKLRGDDSEDRLPLNMKKKRSLGFTGQ